jgi:hypothetical protein
MHLQLQMLTEKSKNVKRATQSSSLYILNLFLNAISQLEILFPQSEDYQKQYWSAVVSPSQ